MFFIEKTMCQKPNVFESIFICKSLQFYSQSF